MSGESRGRQKLVGENLEAIIFLPPDDLAEAEHVLKLQNDVKTATEAHTRSRPLVER